MKKKQFWFVAGTVLLLVLGGLYFVFQGSGNSAVRPNIIFVFADDMDMKLLPYMEQVNALIGQQGAVFNNYFVTAPTCCPSRSSILRGQYPHNSGIFENSPGFEEFYEKGNDEETLATWLEAAGYRNSYMGKYLNLYPAGVKRTYIPPGWDDWHVFLYGPSDNFYYSYTLNENGRLVRYGKKVEEYGTDVLKERALEFIDKRVGKRAPFFLMISVYAPHGPTISAQRHASLFEGIEYPQTESFQEADYSDKPELIRTLIETSGIYEEQDANRLFRRRVQTMQAVDELVAALVQRLDESGELENTYIIFTSDNGFHMGEHSLSSGKMLPYEEDIRVPLLMRGPGIEPGTTVDAMVANIDLAPTLADLVDMKIADFVDGRSAVRFLLPQTDQANETAWRNALLIETGNLDSDSLVIAYRGIRTTTFSYVEYENGELEFYDLVNDPYQMENLASKLDEQTLSALHTWLEELKACQGDTCRQAENVLFEGVTPKP